MRLERQGDDFCIEASLLGEYLDVPADEVQALMRGNEITSVCERGEGEHEGRYRLTFFYKSRRVQLDVDEAGHILRRSTLDFGELSLPRSARRVSVR